MIVVRFLVTGFVGVGVRRRHHAFTEERGRFWIVLGCDRVHERNLQVARLVPIFLFLRVHPKTAFLLLALSINNNRSFHLLFTPLTWRFPVLFITAASKTFRVVIVSDLITQGCRTIAWLRFFWRFLEIRLLGGGNEVVLVDEVLELILGWGKLRWRVLQLGNLILLFLLMALKLLLVNVALIEHLLLVEQLVLGLNQVG